jgi:hypothetical protein
MMPRLRAFAPTQINVMAKSMHRTAITRLSQLRLVLLLVCIASRPNAKVSDGWPSTNYRIAKQHGGPAIRSTES